ncbi:MAG: heme-binding protein [Planctomycetota bacterium]
MIRPLTRFPRALGVSLCVLFAAACQSTGGSVRPATSLPDHAAVTAALRAVVQEQNGGFGLQMWASVVDRDGVVTVVAMSGADRGDQWPGSRVISAQKANTANAFSLPALALSTANLFAAVQPGNSLYGLQASNPVDTKAAYGGDARRFGTASDPMVGRRIGGVNVFGGGLPLYARGELVGALGVSGDSSVADHVIAWKLRHRLELDHVPAGVSPTNDDNMVLDFENGASASGWGHAATTPAATQIVGELPKTHPIRR